MRITPVCEDCNGCEGCAPDLTIVVEDRDDDPWSCMLTVFADTSEELERWLSWKGGYIGGDTWESDGGNMAYAMPSLYVGCSDEWRKEGYDRQDWSSCNESPLDHFVGWDESEIDAFFDSYRRYTGLDEDCEADMRADIAIWQTLDHATWRADTATDLPYADEWKDARLKAIHATQREEARLQADADALQMRLPCVGDNE